MKTDEVRKLDLIAQERFAIPGILLMEHASLNLSEQVLSRIGGKGEKVLILCGKGNNGGDGLACARHLHNRGHFPEVILLGRLDELKSGTDADINGKIAHKMGIPIHEILDTDPVLRVLKDGNYRIHLDAVFGTGLSTPLRGIYPDLFQGINELELPFIAVDVPSGLNSDTGEVMGAAIKAEQTVTFAFAKRGFMEGEGPDYCGDVIVAGIGLPREVEEHPENYL
jgi:NAD(P)H-hydrate epimerase